MIENPFASKKTKLDSFSGAEKALSGIGATEVAYPKNNYISKLNRHQNEWCFSQELLRRAVVELPRSAWEKKVSISLPESVSSDAAEKIISEYSIYHNGLKTNKKVHNLRTREVFARAQIEARIYGGAVVIVEIDDGQHWSQPVNFNKIKAINKLFVRNSNQIALSSEGGFYIEIDDYEHYRINIKDDAIETLTKQTGSSFDHNLIHKSRVIRFDGQRMPDEWMINKNQGWGLSIYDSIYPQYRSYLKALEGIERVIETSSFWVYKMQDLNAILQDTDLESEQVFTQRLKIFNKVLSVWGGMAIDGTEDLSWANRSVNGLDGLVGLLEGIWIAATGIPRTKILGVSPSGLGASGESEQNDWDAAVSKYQIESCEPALIQLDELIFCSKDGPTGGKPLEGGYTYDWPSVIRLSEAQRRASRTEDVGNLQSLLMNAIILDKEARSVLKNQSWWPELTLDEKAWEKAKQQQEQQEGGGEKGVEELPPEYYDQYSQSEEQEQLPEEALEPDQSAQQFDSAIWSNSNSLFSDYELHERVVKDVKNRFKIWPSVYANAWVLEEYEKRGGAVAKNDSLMVNSSLEKIHQARKQYRKGNLSIEKLDSKISLLSASEKIQELNNIKDMLSKRFVNASIKPSCPELWEENTNSVEEKFLDYKRKYYEKHGNIVGLLEI